MSEQTAEERAERYRREGAALFAEVTNLKADVERAEAQRDSLKAQMQEWMEGSAQLQVKLDEAEAVLEDWAGHLRERAEGGGKTEAELRERYELTPRCERVSVPVPCETCTLQHRYVERCAYHGCEWPDGEKGCPAQGELDNIAALGDNHDEYGSVQA